MLCSRLCKADAGESGEPPPPKPGGSLGLQQDLTFLWSTWLLTILVQGAAALSLVTFNLLQSLPCPWCPLAAIGWTYIFWTAEKPSCAKNVTISAKIGSKGWTFLLKTVVICVAHLKSGFAQPNLQCSASKHHGSSAVPKKISVVENKNAVSLTHAPDSWLGFALQDQCTANVFPWSFYKSHLLHNIEILKKSHCIREICWAGLNLESGAIPWFYITWDLLIL